MLFNSLGGGSDDLFKKFTVKGVIEMKLTNKIKANLTAAYMAGCMALSAATTANAADLSGVTNSVTSSVKDIVNVITPIAWAVVILVLVIMGCVLMWGGDKAKEKVKSHITAVVIGCILVAGASTIASWWTNSLTTNFGGGS